MGQQCLSRRHPCCSHFWRSQKCAPDLLRRWQCSAACLSLTRLVLTLQDLVLPLGACSALVRCSSCFGQQHKDACGSEPEHAAALGCDEGPPLVAPCGRRAHSLPCSFSGSPCGRQCYSVCCGASNGAGGSDNYRLLCNGCLPRPKDMQVRVTDCSQLRATTALTLQRLRLVLQRFLRQSSPTFTTRSLAASLGSGGQR